MKRLIPIILLALLAPTTSHAGKFKWLDETGLLHVSDTPPPERFADPAIPTPTAKTPSTRVDLTSSIFSSEPKSTTNEVLLTTLQPVPSPTVTAILDPAPDPAPSIPPQATPAIQVTPPEQKLIASTATVAIENPPKASKTGMLSVAQPSQKEETANSPILEAITEAVVETTMAVEPPETSPAAALPVVDITPSATPETEVVTNVPDALSPTVIAANNLPTSNQATEAAAPTIAESHTTHSMMVAIEPESGGTNSLALPIGGALLGLAALTSGAWFIRRRAMDHGAGSTDVDKSTNERDDSTDTNPFFGDEPVSHENPTLSTLGRA